MAYHKDMPIKYFCKYDPLSYRFSHYVLRIYVRVNYRDKEYQLKRFYKPVGQYCFNCKYFNVDLDVIDNTPWNCDTVYYRTQVNLKRIFKSFAYYGKMRKLFGLFENFEMENARSWKIREHIQLKPGDNLLEMYRNS